MEGDYLSKIVIQLPKPVVAANDCLPHAAMNLGAARGVGILPIPGMVSRIVIDPLLGAWVVHRMDDAGGFVGDTWHDSREDAIAHVKREFAIAADVLGLASVTTKQD